LREKIAYAAVVAFILVSTNVNILNFIWHGFSFTHGLPYRYTFLISFFMITMAYRAYTLNMLQSPKKRHLLAMGIGAAIFVTFGFLGQNDNQHVLWTGILAAILLTVFLVFSEINSFRYTIVKIVLASVVVAELALASFVGIAQFGYTTSHYNYPWVHASVQNVLPYRRPMGNDFFRTDFTARWSTNDPSKYHVQGISLFSSLVDQNTLRFMNGMGLMNWPSGNSYAFNETSPLTTAILNIQYLVDRHSNPADDGAFWHRAGRYNGVLLMENSRRLPLGFMVGNDMEHFVGDLNNPFNTQNDFFRRATGLDGDLFTLQDVIHAGHENLWVGSHDHRDWTFHMDYGQTEGIFRFNYSMPTDAELYAYIRITDTNGIRITTGYEEILHRNISTYFNQPHMFRAGSFEAGRLVTFAADTTVRGGIAQTFVGILGRELFEQGFEIMASETWQLTDFRPTRITGEIATSGGIMFTSIPYTGNWRAFVNGERVNILAIDGAMCAIHLPPGNHTVEFRYHNTSFTTGGIITLISAGLFVLMRVLIGRSYNSAKI